MKHSGNRIAPDRDLSQDLRPREQVVHEIRMFIGQNAMAPHTPLPSARTLAQRLGKPRRTVDRALARLSQEGVLQQNTKRGYNVAPRKDPINPFAEMTVLVSNVKPVANDPHSEPGWHHFITNGAANALKQAGRVVLMCHPKEHPGLWEQLTEYPPRGVVMTAGVDSHVLNIVRRLSVPATVYGGSDSFAAFDCIDSNHEQGGYELGRFLIARGCRLLVQVWNRPAQDYWEFERRVGLKRAQKEAGVPTIQEIVVSGFPTENKVKNRKDWLTAVETLAAEMEDILAGPEHADAILVPSDGAIFGAAAAVRYFGMEPNRDVIVAGYDNYWRDCGSRKWEDFQPLVTIDKQNEQAGRELVKLLEARWNGELPDSPVHRLIPPRLVFTDTQ